MIGFEVRGGTSTRRGLGRSNCRSGFRFSCLRMVVSAFPPRRPCHGNAPAPGGDRRRLHLGPGFATISSSLIFALREREIHFRFFGSKKAPVASSPRFLTVSSHF